MSLEPLFFWGHNAKGYVMGKQCLSNWFPSTFIVEEKINDKIIKLKFHNNEQYFMYQKAKLFGDINMMEKILKEKKPFNCKKLGKLVKNFDKKIWEENCVDLVTMGCYYKFSQDKEFKKFLLSTGDRLLVEASPYDFIWGIGMGELKAKNLPPEKWPGKNYLGICLMNARKMIRDEINSD
jgi:ribA/ribD-fused uncharacterized protein